MSERKEFGPNTPVYLTVDDVRDLTRETVEMTLQGLGVDVSHPLETQQDFARLREWRMSVDSIRRKGVLAAIGVIGSALLAALLIGIKSELTRLLHG